MGHAPGEGGALLWSCLLPVSHTLAFLLAGIEDKWPAVLACAEKFRLQAVRGIEAGDNAVTPGITSFLSREQVTFEGGLHSLGQRCVFPIGV